jgi:hypothetical protein
MTDFLQHILNCSDFLQVDQALFGATQLFLTRYPKSEYKEHYIPAFAYKSIEKAHETTDLSVKKVWLLTLMVCFSEVAEFAVANSHPQKMRKTLEWLEKELPAVFQGKLYKEKKPRDVFVTSVLEYYAAA